jgi:hypothetical protein
MAEKQIFFPPARLVKADSRIGCSTSVSRPVVLGLLRIGAVHSEVEEARRVLRVAQTTECAATLIHIAVDAVSSLQ